MQEPLREMPHALVAFLKSKQLVIVVSTDGKGQMRASAISWVHAVDAKRIRFAVDQRARLLESVEQARPLLLQIVGPDSAYAVHGKGRVTGIAVTDIPLRLSVVEVDVEEVDDVMFYGGVVTTAPTFTVTYGQELSERLDRAVFIALAAEEPLA